VFLADQRLGVPPLADVRRIQQLADSFERGRPLPTADAEAWLATLVIPGSSLGGARPKATVRDVDGSLWIAKFPSHNDRHDVGAWEYVLTVWRQVPALQFQNLGCSAWRHTTPSAHADSTATGKAAASMPRR